MEPMSVQVLLRNSAQEMDRLARLAGALDDALGELSTEAALAGELETLQSVDVLRQSLEAMGGFIGALSEEVDGGIRVDPAAAADRIKLRDLRAACLARPVATKSPEAKQ